MKPFSFPARFRRDRRGGMAVEYALVIPAFIMLVVGMINTSLMAGVVTGMNFAVQESARCYAVDHVLCATPAAAVVFAETRYRSPGADPQFAADTSGCGHTVSATATYELNILVQSWDIPLSASACYPGNEPEAPEAT